MIPSFRTRQVVTAALVANSLRPPSNYWLGVPALLTGWLTSELGAHLLALTVGDSARELTRRDKDRGGLALAAVSAAGLAALIRQAIGAQAVVERALSEGLSDDYRNHLAAQDSDLDLGAPWQQLAFPFRVRNPEVEIIKDIVYADLGKHGRLDLYRRREPLPQNAPVLLQVHSGMWMTGDKKYDAVPLMLHMAARGWVCISINYRLAPTHLFPAQIIDVKRAIAWVKEHVAEFGGDPSFLAISGGSAGGHLAALAALTPGDAEYQPGFEGADTTVQAAVPHYGIYDFAAVSGTAHAVSRRDRFLARYILKKDPVADRDDFERASPALRVNAEAPAFFVIHGAHDTGVEVTEARYFVERLRAVSRQPVVYAELPGAQHSFDILPSIRSAHVVRAVERFLRWSLAQHRARTVMPAGPVTGR